MIGTHSYKCNIPSCSDCSGRPLLDPSWQLERQPEPVAVLDGRTGRKFRNSAATPRWRKRAIFSPVFFGVNNQVISKWKGSQQTFSSTDSLNDFTATVQSKRWPMHKEEKSNVKKKRVPGRTILEGSLCSVCFSYCQSREKEEFGFNRVVAFCVVLWVLDELAGRIGMQAFFAFSSDTNRTRSLHRHTHRMKRGRRPDQ